MSYKCAEPRPKKTSGRTQFAFLGRSAARRRRTAEDELEQLSQSINRSLFANATSQVNKKKCGRLPEQAIAHLKTERRRQT